MLRVAGRGIGTAPATVNKNEDENEGNEENCRPLQACTPDIMMI